ncbi:hypothetical protein FRC08_008909 [Ceratobasidium sp. 394]|nr:hypothetical protein FRC08_008909 [Ceratobasidium sp. 394]
MTSSLANPWGKKKKKTKRTDAPELGIDLDNLKRPGKEAADRSARRRSSGRHDQSREEQTPPGFRSGGYLELAHGDNVRRDRRPSAVRSQRRESEARPSRAPEQNDPDRSGRSESVRSIRNSVGGSERAGRGRRNEHPADPEPSDDPDDATYRNNSDSERSSSSDSSDESDDSDSSSSDEDEARKLRKRLKRMRSKQKKLEKKLVAQARSGYKAQAPKSYNGEPDFDKFELFVFNYDNWCLDTKLSTRKCVRNVSRFLEGKPSIWYMSNVAPNINTYDMKRIYQGIFDYCFPPDFKENLRRKYMRKQQGDQSVQDYFAELELMRRRLKITETQHVHRAYDSAARYIKGEWVIKGILPEDTTIDELCTTALDIERAHKIRKSIEQHDGGKHKRDRSKSPDRRDGKRGNHHRSDKRFFPKTDEKKTEPAKTAKQRDEYRAANKCFECGETGHLVKDCPSRNKAKPSKISSNAVSVQAEEKVRASAVLLKELDKLTEIRDLIEVSAVTVELNAASASKKSAAPTERRLMERNATRVKDLARKVPSTLVVQAEIQGESVRALLDSGSQADLVSTTLVDQLRLNKTALAKPLQLQMVMSGSRGMLMYSVEARIKYQEVDENRMFDVGNIENYDIILGTPFLFQHSMRISFNPNSVFIGSAKALPLDGSNIIHINSLSTDVVEARMAELREML